MQSCYFAAMKTLTVREVPDMVYAVLKETTQTHGRSLQAQILWVLEKETRLVPGAFTEHARRWRRRFAGRNLGDSVADIRAGRERA